MAMAKCSWPTQDNAGQAMKETSATRLWVSECLNECKPVYLHSKQMGKNICQDFESL